jgi:hypothetical protein
LVQVASPPIPAASTRPGLALASVANANATRLDASFWIETVKQADGTTFQQLQYTQTVILNFLGVNWPHISVATLIKQ